MIDILVLKVYGRKHGNTTYPNSLRYWHFEGVYPEVRDQLVSEVRACANLSEVAEWAGDIHGTDMPYVGNKKAPANYMFRHIANDLERQATVEIVEINLEAEQTLEGLKAQVKELTDVVAEYVKENDKLHRLNNTQAESISQMQAVIDSQTAVLKRLKEELRCE